MAVSDYANRAFRELFPGPAESPLDRIRQALCSDAESEAQFRRLRGRAAAGVPATATLSLTQKSTAETGRLKIEIDPIAGHPGYSYWSLQDVSASLRSEAVLREERNLLANLLDNAPIGFYSVNDSGHFRFVNRTLAQWLGSTPSELMTRGARLSRFFGLPAQPPGHQPGARFAHRRLGHSGARSCSRLVKAGLCRPGSRRTSSDRAPSCTHGQSCAI